MPAKEDIQGSQHNALWIPASAGMTYSLYKNAHIQKACQEWSQRMFALNACNCLSVLRIVGSVAC